MDDATTAVRYLLGGVMLAGAVLFDLKDRRVPNPWWVPFAALAGILAVGDLADPARDWQVLGVRYGMSITVAAAFYGMWRMRLFGGADAKGLIVLALLAPIPPAASMDAIQPALDALGNGAMMMLAVPVAFLLYNVLRGDLALPAALLGRRIPLDQARQRHVWPMQRADPKAPGGLGWRYWQRLSGDLEAEYEALERLGVQSVWVTPKVPFMLLLLLGWALSWRWGSLLFAGAKALSGA